MLRSELEGQPRLRDAWPAAMRVDVRIELRQHDGAGVGESISDYDCLDQIPFAYQVEARGRGVRHSTPSSSITSGSSPISVSVSLRRRRFSGARPDAPRAGG